MLKIFLEDCKMLSYLGKVVGVRKRERENYPTKAEYTFLVKTFIEKDYILDHKIHLNKVFKI